MNVDVIKVHAFTSNEHGGNPAGVMLEPGVLTESQMKKISNIIDVSETAYVFPSEKADYFVRFFSPSVEVDLCGHATIAAFTVIADQLRNNVVESVILTQETKAGILSVQVNYTKSMDVDLVLMKQTSPIFKDVTYDSQMLADMLNIPVEKVLDNYPKQRVSTGLYTLPVCVDSLHTLEKMKPDFHRIKKYCATLKVGSIHVFSFETYDPHSVYHARNFAPLYGINEDPVTGTANGAVCSYLHHHHIISDQNLICEQGDIIGKKGRVQVNLQNDEVWVGGKALVKEQITLDL